MPDSLLENLPLHTTVLALDESYIETDGVPKKVKQQDLKNYFLAGVAAVSWEYTVDIADPANQDYVLWWDAPFAGTITKIRTKTQANSCLITGKINTVPLGGLPNAATTAAQEQVHASNNVFVKGDKVLLTASNDSGVGLLTVTLYGTRS